MSSEIIIFTLGLVTMATTLTKEYTIVINFCSSKHNNSSSKSNLNAYYNGFLGSLYL